MNKKQRLLNAVKTLNLTLEQRQELVEAIEDLGGSSGKILNVSMGIVETDTSKMFLEINNVKIIQDATMGVSTIFSFTKDDLFKMFNVNNVVDIAVYDRINLKIYSLQENNIEISNYYLKTNILIIPNVTLKDNIKEDTITFMNGDTTYIDIIITGNDVEFIITL